MTEAWSSSIGDEYFARNPFEVNVDRQRKFLGYLLPKCPIFPCSVTEFGCRDGANLSAIAELFPGVKTRGVEINVHAAEAAKSRGHDVFCGDCLDSPRMSDLVLWCGTLIHIRPDDLPLAYKVTDESARHHVLMAEYFSPKPQEISYRDGIYLAKRDFAAEFMDAYPHWKLRDYGFAYKRDVTLGRQDNVTWFLMERAQ